MDANEIGQLIKKRRSILGLRQEDLSEMSGINMRTIQLTEMGKGNPSLETLEKISSILGLEIVVQVKQLENG